MLRELSNDTISQVIQSHFPPQAALSPQPTSNSASRPSGLDDDALIEKAGKSKNGAVFQRLMDGNWTGYKSQSEADDALMCLLAWWSGNDHVQMRRIFLTSGLASTLHRKQNQEDYLKRTIRDAISKTHDTYQPRQQLQKAARPQPESKQASVDDMELPPIDAYPDADGQAAPQINQDQKPAQDAAAKELESHLSVDWRQYTGQAYITTVPEPFDYFLENVFLRGDIGGIIGAPGSGKGHLAIRMCAYIGAGLPVFGEWRPVKPEISVYISAEDRLQTIQYRFRDACFDLPQDLQSMAAKNFIGIPVHGRVEICRGERNASISTTKNYYALCKLIEEIKPGLVILDTLSRFFGLEENDNAGMTAACGLLEEAAFKYGCNILMIHHTNKASGDLIDKEALLDSALSQAAFRGASSLAGAFRLLINCVSLGNNLAGVYLGEEAKRENPGRYMTVRLGMNNHGPLGEKMFFRRGQYGFLTRVEPIDQEAAIKDDARKLTAEVQRRENTGETQLSESKGGREVFDGWGGDRCKKATEKAIQMGLLESVDKEKGKGKVLKSRKSSEHQDFGMYNYE